MAPGVLQRGLDADRGAGPHKGDQGQVHRVGYQEATALVDEEEVLHVQ